MPNRVQWDPCFSVGHDVIDTQHQSLLGQCNLLADCCAEGDGDASEHGFDQAIDKFKVMTRQHFEAEALLLAELGCADLEAYQLECDEFEYLATEVATIGNFHRIEVQRFLALWCLGHVMDSAKQLRACPAGGTAST